MDILKIKTYPVTNHILRGNHITPFLWTWLSNRGDIPLSMWVMLLEFVTTPIIIRHSTASQISFTWMWNSVEIRYARASNFRYWRRLIIQAPSANTNAQTGGSKHERVQKTENNKRLMKKQIKVKHRVIVGSNVGGMHWKLKSQCLKSCIFHTTSDNSQWFMISWFLWYHIVQIVWWGHHTTF